MKSMTGYGSASFRDERFALDVQIKSYNNRYLDIKHNMPMVFEPFASELDDRIKTCVARGRVDLSIKLTILSSETSFSVDRGAVKAYADAFHTIGEASGYPMTPTLSDFLSLGVVTPVEESDNSRYKEPLFATLESALEQYEINRDREGEATCCDLKKLGGQMTESLKVIASRADELESLIKENLLTRIEQMLGDRDYPEERVLTEVATLLVRYSVNEEIVRLETHLKEYARLLTLSEPVGKRLDFLCQEMNREVNTIGSKSQIVEMNLEVVKMKDSLENIREQIRNIE